jgi:hypothetical protein
MNFTVEYNPDFFNDIAQAVDWYSENQAFIATAKAIWL